jgi:cell division protein FtsW
LGLSRASHRPNYILLLTIVGLIVLGSVLISSASVVLSLQHAETPNYYFIQHLVALCLGIPLFLFGFKVDYSFWKRLAPLIMLGSIILMVAVFIPGLGMEHGGARRWLNLGFINFAPAEIFKLALIIYLAAWFDKRGGQIKKFFSATLPFLSVIIFSGFLIMMQPDLGTMMVVALTTGAIYFVAGANLFHVAIMAGGGIAAVMAMILGSHYRTQRLMIFLNPSSDTSGQGYQINQALLAIGSGGLFGLGFGHSRQKFNYLPEAASDSIFAITAEELGFLRSSLIVIAFLVIAYQGYRVAQKAPDVFSRLLAVGITTWIVVQGLLNISAMMSIIPLTGIPLPFISMGSTSTVILMLASGILLNISKHTEGENRESRSLRRRNWWSYFTGYSRN